MTKFKTPYSSKKDLKLIPVYPIIHESEGNQQEEIVESDQREKNPESDEVSTQEKKINVQKKQRTKKPAHLRWTQQLHDDFVDFVIQNQYLRLVEFHPLQNIYNSEWEQSTLVFYDLVLNYFLKVSNLQQQQKIQLTKSRLIIIQDDQFRLELKQYFPVEPLQLQVMQLKQESVSSSQIQLFYNRQLNIFGFLLHNSNGFVRNAVFSKQQNILLPLYQKQTDPLQKYKDNRTKVIQLLVQIPAPYYMNKFNINYTIETQQIRPIYQLEALEPIVSAFINLISNYIPGIKFLLDQQDSKRKELRGNIHQIIAYFLKTNLMGLFFRFIEKRHNKKDILLSDFNVKDVESKYIDRRIKQIQNYDQNFDLRILQYLYKQQFGFNKSIKKAKNPNDFYQLIPFNAVSIMQEKLRIYKQQINAEKQLDCQHYTLLKKSEDPGIILKQILDLVQTFAVPIVDGDQIEVIIGLQDPAKSKEDQNKIQIALDQMQCNTCNTEIFCYHHILDKLLQIEAISEDYYEQLIQPFQQRDLSIFTFSSFCKICGSSFPIKVDMIQIYENIDPNKKYKVIKQIFKILFPTILTSFSFKQKYFFQDFLQHYYYPLKEELQMFKKNTNYNLKKQQTTFFFIAAYFQSLKGDNIMIDQKLQYKYSQIKNISFEQFTMKVQQIQQKFQIQSSIIIPSMTTVQHIYNSQLKKPIIGAIISAKPDLLTQLLIRKIPIYPELYQIDKYIRYFDSKIDTLSPELITQIVNTSAVDVLNRSSEVVKRYDLVKQNYGRHMERYSTYMYNRKYTPDFFISLVSPKTFEPQHFKDEFYIKYCPVTLKLHKDEKIQQEEQKEQKCKDCNNKEVRVTNDKFKEQFYQLNRVDPVSQYKYPEMWDMIIFPRDYDDKYLQAMAKTLQVSYFQVVNFGGFSYLDINIISKFSTYQQLVEHQVQFYNKISLYNIQSSEIDGSQIPKDLKFISKIQANWNVYKTRMYYIIEKSQNLLQGLASTQEIFNFLNDFSTRCYQMKRKGTTNYFVDCQILVNYLFKHIIPELQKQVNPQLLKIHVNQMLKDDIILADKYSQIGAFRHKKHTEINQEKVFKQLQEQDSLDQASDEDNDYVDQLTKKTLYDPDYED